MDVSRVDDALSWPFLAEQLRAEGVTSESVGDLIAIGRDHTGFRVNPGLLLESVLQATVDFGVMPQLGAVIAAILEEGLQAGQLRQAIRRAHRESAERDGSGETLDGSGVSALVGLRPHFDPVRNGNGTAGVGTGGGPGESNHQHDASCSHEQAVDQQGAGTQHLIEVYELGQGNQTPPHPIDPVEWTPGTGQGRPEHTDDGEVPLNQRVFGHPDTAPAHAVSAAAEAESQWVQGSGAGGLHGTRYAEPPAEPGGAEAHDDGGAEGHAPSEGAQGEWEPGSGRGRGDGNGGGQGLNHTGHTE